jgi:hypothetical protein
MYMVVVADKNFAAEAQTGFAVMPKTPVPEKNFILGPATTIQGRVTLGKEQKPLAGQYMYLRQVGSDNIALPDLLPNPTKSRTYVQPQIAQVLKTDADGRYQFRAGPGKYHLSGPEQVKGVQVTVTDEAQLEYDFNAPREEKGRLTGLVVAGSPSAPVSNVKVSGVYRASTGAGDLLVTTNAEGRFDSERRRHRIVLYARSNDGKLAGIVEIGPDDATVTIPIAPVATARGRLVDGDTAEPLADREICYGVRIPVGEDPNSPWRTDFGGKVLTDKAGRFELKGLVAGQKWDVNLTMEKGESWRTLQTVSPSAGETVLLGDLKVMPERKPLTAAEMRRAAFDVKGTPAERFEKAQRDARLSNQHLLVIFASPDEKRAMQLYAAARDREELRSTLDDYRTLWIPTDRDRLAPAQELAKKLRVDVGADTAPLMIAVNKDGEPIGVQDTATLLKNGKLDHGEVKQFLAGLAPERLDAEKLLADALARAALEKKRVLVQETATWCGPCWRLSRFLDANRALWEKDYVWIKLDHRWTGAADVAKRLRKGAEGGIPWTAILDADGKVLATSNDKQGQNIGFPSDAAAIVHFGDMLRTTATRLTPAEITRFTEALKAANVP